MDKKKYEVNVQTTKVSTKVKKNIYKKYIIVGVSFVVILIVILLTINSIHNQKLERERLERISLAEKEVSEKIVIPIAEEFDLSDMKYDHLEVDELNGIVYFYSDEYENLSNEQKLLLLVIVASITYLDDDIFPDESEAHNKYFQFRVLTGKHKYYDFTTFDGSWLMRDDDKIFEMDTEYANEVLGSLNSKTDYSSSTSNCKSNGVQCRSGFEPCNPNREGTCVSCCKIN